MARGEAMRQRMSGWADKRMVAALTVLLSAHPLVRLSAQSDTAEARRVFLGNIDAIHKRDRARYLSYYLDSPNFTRNGPAGMQLGFAPFAAVRDTTWPDSLMASDIRLVQLQPGLVYGSYRYRVTQRGVTSFGTSERVFVRTPAGMKIAVSTAFPAPPGTPPPPLVLLGATLIDGRGGTPIADAVVVTANGRIACAGPRGSCAGGDAPRDTMLLAGSWIIPGLIDAHVHFSQTGWVDGRPDALDRRADHPYERVQAELETRPERLLRAYVCSGVTAVFDVGGFPWTWALRRRAESDLEAPHVSAAGPLLSTVDRPILGLPDSRQILHVPDDTAAVSAVRSHVARGSDAIKIWYIAGRNADTAALSRRVRLIGAEARRLGARLIVHATGLRQATEAVEAGANLLVHGVGDQPVDENFLRLARDRGVIYTPTLTVTDGYRQVRERRFEPHYPLDCVDPVTLEKARATDTIPGGASQPAPGTPAERARLSMANLLAVHRAGITVAMGTDAGNPLTLHGPSVYWEMEMMQEAGMTPAEVLVAATRNGARAMGRESELGTIEAGRAADLVVLRSDPLADIRNVRNVTFVMRGGSMTTPVLLSPLGR